MGSLMGACNAKEEEEGVTSDYQPSESVAITNFSLAPDIRVMKNLDSVYFSIDLEHGVVFNADSLPKGTNITKLVPKISYPSTVTSATIEMKGGTHREGTVNYYKNSSDTIDFTGEVTLTLGTSNDALSKTYRLKVNVHQEDPDTLYWKNLSSSDLPSRFASPVEQKTVVSGNDVVSLICEANNTYTLSKTPDIFKGNWTKVELEAGFQPVVRSFTATSDGNFYVISADQELMTSGDGINWTAVASGWTSIIGEYSGSLLGISVKDGDPDNLVMKSWPDNSFPEMTLPRGFPIRNFTTPIEFTNRWTPDPTIVIFGGYPSPDYNRSASWAFDGSQWVDIAEIALPPLSGMSVVKYYSYLNSASNGLLKEFEVYLAFGGRDSGGNPNNTIYISYDHGINWQKAPSYMQLPEGISAGYQVDALSLGTTLESNLSNRWKAVTSKRRLPFEIDGDVIKWECPYIFLFGGYNLSEELNTTIYSGLLQRLSFEPLF